MIVGVVTLKLRGSITFTQAQFQHRWKSGISRGSLHDYLSRALRTPVFRYSHDFSWATLSQISPRTILMKQLKCPSPPWSQSSFCNVPRDHSPKDGQVIVVVQRCSSGNGCTNRYYFVSDHSLGSVRGLWIVSTHASNSNWSSTIFTRLNAGNGEIVYKMIIGD
jgi:hypothetical protein